MQGETHRPRSRQASAKRISEVVPVNLPISASKLATQRRALSLTHTRADGDRPRTMEPGALQKAPWSFSPISPIRTAVATEAWSGFLRSKARYEFPQSCNPPYPKRNATMDYRNLASCFTVGREECLADVRKSRRCEQPSEKAHLRRLHQASLSLAHRPLKVVVIGANEMGWEHNEWMGSLIRNFQWNASVIEPQPTSVQRLRANFPPEQFPNVKVHQLHTSSPAAAA